MEKSYLHKKSDRPILAQTLPISERPVLKDLLDSCHKTRSRIWAKYAPFDTKGLLKARGYRWSTHPTDNYKAWMIETYEDQLESELKYLCSDIYHATSINIPIQTINAYNRFI